MTTKRKAFLKRLKGLESELKEVSKKVKELDKKEDKAIELHERCQNQTEESKSLLEHLKAELMSHGFDLSYSDNKISKQKDALAKAQIVEILACTNKENHLGKWVDFVEKQDKIKEKIQNLLQEQEIKKRTDKTQEPFDYRKIEKLREGMGVSNTKKRL